MKTSLSVDGNIYTLDGYNIDGNIYCRISDLSELFEFKVKTDSNRLYIYTNQDDTVIVSKSSGGSPNKITEGIKNTQQGSKRTSFIYCDTELNIVDTNNDDKEIRIDSYDKKSFEFRKTKTIKYTQDEFGGFYAGKQYNYIVLGNNNQEENNKKEVIRVVKYAKEFKEISYSSITGGQCFTTVPFDVGSVSIDENGDDLVIHTSRERYTSSDGLNHQSQLTIVLDSSTMELKNDLELFQDNHVSHSFSQYVKFDGKNYVLADLGDAYPRGIVLNKYDGKDYTSNVIYKIPGELGVNNTGTRVGGLEVSNNNYLTVITSVDQNKVNYLNPEFMGGAIEEYEEGASRKYDVMLLTTPKNKFDNGKSKLTTISNCISRGMQASVPYIVKVNDDKFVILWQDFKNNGYSWGIEYGVNYVIIDGEGNLLSEIQNIKHSALPEDCQPIYMDNNIVWCVNTSVGRVFYTLSIK